MTFNNQAVRYTIVAIAAYLIDFGGFWLLTSAGFSIVKSNIAVKVAAALFGFVAHRTFTYQMKSRENVVPHAIKYFGLALVYTPLATFVLFLLLNVIPFPLAAKFAADLTLLLGTYIVTSRFIFSRKT